MEKWGKKERATFCTWRNGVKKSGQLLYMEKWGKKERANGVKKSGQMG
jgi:hypothetical protein